MTPGNLEKTIEEAIPSLLDMAREMTWNKISSNCKFILSEIIDIPVNFRALRVLNKKVNDKKIPVSLEDIMPELQSIYENLYDINLVIYSARKDLTVIDIRYYPKSALDHDYRQTVLDKPPMFHCNVSIPPGLAETKEKFDINWEHYEVTGGHKMHKIYKQSVIYPAILLLVIAVLHAVVINLFYDIKRPVYETVVINLIAALMYGLVICALSLTIFLNRFGRITANRMFSALSWFLLPGAFISLAFGKAINEYLTVDSVWEIEYALIARLPFIAGLVIGFRKFRTLGNTSYSQRNSPSD